MANVRSGNTWYVDTASDSLTGKNISLVGIIITATSGAGSLVLGDDISSASYPVKFEWSQATGSSAYVFLAQTPIVFPNGIRVKTATNVHATLIVKVPGESS
jgi:hypothetical protein